MTIKRVVANLGVLAFISLSLTLSRAAVPVEDDILDQISLSSSENYYPNLMMRFEQGDTTLTAANYHYLYYGFAYQDIYKPLATNPHMDKFLLLASGLDIESPNADILRSVIATGIDALKSDPFNPKIWNMLAYAYGALGDTINEQAAYLRVENILATIKSSGSGVREKSPQHILMFDHALDLLASENLTYTKSMIISRTVEYIPLLAPRTVDGKKIRGFYFDYSRIYRNKPDSITFTRDRTWQFNNLKPREYK